MIDYGFHVTLMLASLIVLRFFWVAARRAYAHGDERARAWPGRRRRLTTPPALAYPASPLCAPSPQQPNHRRTARDHKRCPNGDTPGCRSG